MGAGVVAVTADRRWQEQADLLRKRGFDVVHGPTMRTVDLTADGPLRAVTDALVAAPPDVLVVTTGAGLRQWLDHAEEWGLREALVGAFRSGGTAVVCRGAKGASAARGNGLEVSWRAQGESMDEVVAHLRDVVGSRRDTRVALQLFDPDDHWATVELRALVDDLIEVPVYRWLLPDDLAPAEDLVRRIAARQVVAVTFTSQPAVRFLFVIAERLGVVDEVRAALGSDVLAVCVGAVCAEALHESGVDRAAWPDPPRLVPMVKLLEERLGAPEEP